MSQSDAGKGCDDRTSDFKRYERNYQRMAGFCCHCLHSEAGECGLSGDKWCSFTEGNPNAKNNSDVGIHSDTPSMDLDQ